MSIILHLCTSLLVDKSTYGPFLLQSVGEEVRLIDSTCEAGVDYPVRSARPSAAARFSHHSSTVPTVCCQPPRVAQIGEDAAAAGGGINRALPAAERSITGRTRPPSERPDEGAHDRRAGECAA
jgi:hypothetical protein